MTAAVIPLSAQAYVYVIGPRHGPQKVGIASDPRHRLGIFQVGNWSDLHIHIAIPVMRHEAVNVEKYAHVILKDQHVRGEWFNVTPDTAVKALKDAIDAVATGEPPPNTEHTTAPKEISLRSPVRIDFCQARAARYTLGWSLRDLKDKAGVGPNTISRFESGARNISLETLLKIQHAFEQAGITFPDEFTVSCRKVPDQP